MFVWFCLIAAIAFTVGIVVGRKFNFSKHRIIVGSTDKTWEIARSIAQLSCEFLRTRLVYNIGRLSVDYYHNFTLDIKQNPYLYYIQIQNGGGSPFSTNAFPVFIDFSDICNPEFVLAEYYHHPAARFNLSQINDLVRAAQERVTGWEIARTPKVAVA